MAWFPPTLICNHYRWDCRTGIFFHNRNALIKEYSFLVFLPLQNPKKYKSIFWSEPSACIVLGPRPSAIMNGNDDQEGGDDQWSPPSNLRHGTSRPILGPFLRRYIVRQQRTTISAAAITRQFQQHSQSPKLPPFIIPIQYNKRSRCHFVQ